MKIVLQIILGLLIADILAGFFHWFEDTYLDYCIKIPLLTKIANDNEMHHYYPREIVMQPWYITCKVTFMLSVIILFIICIIAPKHVYKYKYFYITLAIFGTLSNLFHKWSHMRDCELNPVLQFLQNINIISGHKHHSKHHNENVDSLYAVIFPITNIFLDNLNIFRILEKCIELCFNILPTRKGSYDSYINNGMNTYMHDNTKKNCPDVITESEKQILVNNLDVFYKCSL